MRAIDQWDAVFEDEMAADAFDLDAFDDGFDETDYSVVGPTDDRFQIHAQRQHPSTRLFPFNTICLLERRSRVGPSSPVSRVTGTLIAPQVVLTAKHCLMRNIKPPCSTRRVMGTYYPRITVIPGANRSPSGHSRSAQPASMMVSSSRFRVDPNLDYGVIILPRPFQRPNQFMMLQPRRDAGIATQLTIAGYPCDKPVGTMWAHSDRIPLAGVGATHLRYPIDTCRGQSGSPIWLLASRNLRLLLGVHTTGRGCDNDPVGTQCLRTGAPVTPVTGQNCGVRITCHVIDNILRWCREFGVRQLPQIDWSVYRQRCQ